MSHSLANDIIADGVNIDVEDIERIIDIYERIIATSSENGVTAHFTMDISYSSVADSITITAQSNVLVDSNDSDPVIIAVNTFPPEIQERINKAMPETKEN